MPGPRPVTRVERFAPWAAGALLALPVLVSHYPPMVDLPLHEAIVGLLRHWGDPRFVPANVYQLNLGLANQLFYFLVLPLAYVVSTGAAMKVVVAATLLFFPVAVARIADYLGVTRLAALVVAPLGLGWMFFWGLLANLIGLDLYLFALPDLDRLAQRPTPRRLAVACGWVVLLHFTHDLMALVAAGTLLVFLVTTRRTWREDAVRAAPAVLAVALAVSSRLLAARITAKHHEGYADADWMPLTYKIDTAPSVLYAGAGTEWWIRYVIFAICQTPVALFAVERWRNRARGPRAWRTWLDDFRFEILGASLVVSYLVAPVNLKGTTLIYHRFLPPAWVLLTLGAFSRAPLERPWRLPRLVSVFLPLVPLLASWPRFADSDVVYRDLDATIAHMEPRSSYLVLQVGPMKTYWIDNPGAAGGHVVAALGGRCFFDYTLSEAAPVYQRVEAQWTEIYQRVDGRPLQMMPSHDLTRYRYVLVHASDDEIAGVAVLAMAPEARLAFHEGEWTLLESTLPLVPLDAPDAPLPVPAPRTFGERFLEVIGRVERLPPGKRGLPFEGAAEGPK